MAADGFREIAAMLVGTNKIYLQNLLFFSTSMVAIFLVTESLAIGCKPSICKLARRELDLYYNRAYARLDFMGNFNCIKLPCLDHPLKQGIFAETFANFESETNI